MLLKEQNVQKWISLLHASKCYSMTGLCGLMKINLQQYTKYVPLSFWSRHKKLKYSSIYYDLNVFLSSRANKLQSTTHACLVKLVLTCFGIPWWLDIWWPSECCCRSEHGCGPYRCETLQQSRPLHPGSESDRNGTPCSVFVGEKNLYLSPLGKKIFYN